MKNNRERMTKSEEVEALHKKHKILSWRGDCITQTIAEMKCLKEKLHDEAIATWAEMKKIEGE
ncbi:MAG TPA: hypothetical protein ENH82_14150 [bacterium]|nr:hypothetical protein [bacterium]